MLKVIVRFKSDGDIKESLFFLIQNGVDYQTVNISTGKLDSRVFTSEEEFIKFLQVEKDSHKILSYEIINEMRNKQDAVNLIKQIKCGLINVGIYTATNDVTALKTIAEEFSKTLEKLDVCIRRI